jgi:glycosyltransferase involved in cell wall biosynthesis
MMKTLHIGLIMQGGHGWVGGIEYIKNIVLALASLPGEVRSTFKLCLICSQTIEKGLYQEIVPYIETIFYEELEKERPTFFNRLRWEMNEALFQRGNYPLDRFLRKAGFDFVFPYFSPGKKTFHSAAWVYDFQHKYLKDLFSEKEIEERNRLFSLTARYAWTVILSSNTVKSDLDSFFPKAALKSRVLSFRVYPDSSWYETDPIRTQREYSLPERFFLVCNQFWRHKNHLIIFEALKRLKEKCIYPVVVCTGRLDDYRQPSYSDQILQTIHRGGLAQQVFLLGMIPRIDQIQLLRRALALIQPSLFEGWSTVVEEARCLAKPIIISDIPVHLEQNPPQSFFFDRSSSESLASHLERCWESLSPGPNSEEEAEARTESLKEAKAFGFRFLELARAG